MIFSEFADYLAELDSVASFDNETCPVCGVNISETLSVQIFLFVQYKSKKEEAELLSISKELNLRCIPHKI